MADKQDELKNGEEINTVQEGEKLERENAEEFGEPLKK